MNIPLHVNNDTRKALNEGTRLYGISYAWGPMVNFQQSGTGRRLVLTSHEETEPVTVSELLTEQEKLSSTSNQDFVHFIDQTIRVQNSNLCLTADTNDYITIRHCSRKTSCWIYSSSKFICGRKFVIMPNTIYPIGIVIRLRQEKPKSALETCRGEY